MAYNPSLFKAQNIPFATSDSPLNAKSLFYDAVNFKFRPFLNIAEVNSYFNILSYRDPTFDVIINTGGTLLNGVITGGVNDAYWYKDGTANGNLVLKTNSVDLTPYYTKIQIDDFLLGINTIISEHISDTSNPHEVTASQVGAYSYGEIDAKLSFLKIPYGGSESDISIEWTAGRRNLFGNNPTLTPMTDNGDDTFNKVNGYSEQRVYDTSGDLVEIVYNGLTESGILFAQGVAGSSIDITGELYDELDLIKQNKSEKDQNSGYAGLDANSNIGSDKTILWKAAPYTSGSVRMLYNLPWTATKNVISSDVPSLSYGWRVGKGVSYRSGYYTTPNFGHRAGVMRYFKDSAGNVTLLTDLSVYKAETIADFVSKAVYVNPDVANGDPSNTNDGLTWATAKKRFDHALALNPDIIYIKSGVLQGQSQFAASMTINKDLAIIAVGGPVIAGTPQKGAWSKEGGYTNVWRRATEAQGTPILIMDTHCRTVDQTPKTYTLAGSVALVDSTPGSYYRESGGGILLHPFDGRRLMAKDISIIHETIGNEMLITFTGNYKLYMEGITFTGMPRFVVKGDGNVWEDSVFYNKSCRWLGVRENGLAIRDIGLCISTDESEVSLSTRDGFNYHFGDDLLGGGTTLSPHFIEVGCIATRNGFNRTDLNNQGSTSHEDCFGYRFGGMYADHQDGGNIVDVGGTKCFMGGVKTRNSSIVGMYLSSAAGGTTGNIAEWWIDGCEVTENATAPAAGNGDISVAGGFARLHVVDEVTDKAIYVLSNVPVADRIIN
jgi:hypothetical protein